MQLGSSTARAVSNGLGWLFAQSLAGRIIAFGSQIILARLLVPQDFGKLALAGTVTAVVGALISFGVDDVLLQRQDRIRFWITPAFWTSLAMGVSSMLAVCISAPLAAAAFRTPELVWMLLIMSLCMPLGTLVTVPTVIMRAELNFRLIALLATLELAALQILTIFLALLGFGAFSFVIPMPLVAAAKAGVFWGLTRPRFGPFRKNQFRPMAFQGAAVFGTRLIISIVGQGSYFILGLLASPSVVGTYYFAFRLAFMPVNMLAGNVSSVLFPALAQFRDDPDRQHAAAIKAARGLAFAVMPYCFLQAAVAEPAIRLIFGQKWLDAIPLIQILSVGLAFDAVAWIAGTLLSARGEFRRSLAYTCWFSPFFFVLVTAGALSGSAIGVAIAVSLYYVLIMPIVSYIVFRRGKTSLRDMANIYIMPAVIAGLSMSLAYVASRLLPSGDITQIALIVVAGCGLYVGLVRLLSPATFAELASRFLAVRTSSKLGPAAG
ncbi:MAG: lipopolysaccharide biosynthesis protein [Alphaproteobacteria bacterium]|nr:lipopolysaccharide biosynthesis protein [Alphaproteobacteria bacterium]